METTSGKTGSDSPKVRKKLPKVPGEPKFKGRPPREVFKEIQEKRIAHQIKTNKQKRFKKLNDFVDEWLKNDGNATEAAMRVFNCKSRIVAGSLGSEYLKKARSLARMQMEQHGYTYGKMVKIAGKKMETSKTPEWWDRLMKLGGYEDFMSKKGAAVSVNILATQKDVIKSYIKEEEIVDVEEDNQS